MDAWREDVGRCKSGLQSY